MVTFILALGLINGGLILAYLYFENEKFNKVAIETTGKILQLESKIEVDSEGGEKEVLFATVTFNTLFGSEITEKSISADIHKVGDIIPVFYNPDNAKQVIFLNKTSSKILLLIGLTLILISIALVIYNWNEWLDDFKQSSSMWYWGIGLFLMSFIYTWIQIYKKKK